MLVLRGFGRRVGVCVAGHVLRKNGHGSCPWRWFDRRAKEVSRCRLKHGTHGGEDLLMYVLVQTVYCGPCGRRSYSSGHAKHQYLARRVERATHLGGNRAERLDGYRWCCRNLRSRLKGYMDIRRREAEVVNSSRSSSGKTGVGRKR